MACLQGGRVTLVSGFTPAWGQEIAQVYKQNVINARLHSKGLEKLESCPRVGEFTPPGVFAREKAETLLPEKAWLPGKHDEKKRGNMWVFG